MKHTIILALLSMPTALFTMQRVLSLAQPTALRGVYSLAQNLQLHGVERNMFSKKCFCSMQEVKCEICGMQGTKCKVLDLDRNRKSLDYQGLIRVFAEISQKRKSMKSETNTMKNWYGISKLGLCSGGALWCTAPDRIAFLGMILCTVSAGSTYLLRNELMWKGMDLSNLYPLLELECGDPNVSLQKLNNIPTDSTTYTVHSATGSGAGEATYHLGKIIKKQDEELKEMELFLNSVPKNKKGQEQCISKTSLYFANISYNDRIVTPIVKTKS